MKFAHNFNAPLPDKALFIQTDEEAYQIATYYEVANELKDPGGDGPRYQAKIIKEHPTHWVVIKREWGHSEPSENGWSVSYEPKSRIKTYEAAVSFLKTGNRARS